MVHADGPTTAGFLIDSLSTSELEDRLEEIDFKLENLASFSLRGGIGSIGYRSLWDSDQQWILVDLGQVYPIDEIIIVPCLWRHPTAGFQADAFPQRLRVFAGTDSVSEGSIIAEYKTSEDTPSGVAPLVLPISGLKASWVRIEASELTKRNFDGQKVLQLSEILIFSGTSNVALHSKVDISSSDKRSMTGAWDDRFLVDGFTPYLMDSAKGFTSNAFIATIEDDPTLTLDLGAIHSISLINLHAVEQSDTVPQAYSGDLGIPKRMRIEGATSPDFSDAVLLMDYRKGDLNETGPILSLKIAETRCRYVRFVPLKVPDQDGLALNQNRIGFAEIEVFEDGRNVALEKQVSSRGLRYGNRRLDTLTDGNNLYGSILPLREWMNELAERGALELERPIIAEELNHRYTKQKKLLAWMVRLVLLLVIGIVIIILIDRFLRMRKISQVRERIAADLHDDLGANIHTIGLISDMAKKAAHSPDELMALLDQIREFTEKSGEAAQYCTNILEARGICENLVEEMRVYSERALADFDHKTYFEGDSLLYKLDPHKRVDLFLFYKECLTNILRHSGASCVFTKMRADKKAVVMTVTDNGIGIGSQSNRSIPKSLKRRAKLLGAKVTTEQPSSGGTRVILNLKTRKFGIL